MSLVLVEEIEQLANCRSEQECAVWLLSCPLNKLAKYEMTIRNRLQIRCFVAGVEYLEEELRRWRGERYLGEPPTDAGYLSALRYVTAIAMGTLPGATDTHYD
jgi:hypothetical protein